MAKTVFPASKKSALRVIRFVALIVVFFACAASTDLRAQAQGDKPLVNCPICNHKGASECKKCRTRRKVFEASGAKLDSEILRCKTCEGSFLKDCSKCENTHVEAERGARISELEKWTEEQRGRVDEIVDHKCMHAQSRWFFITCDLKPMMVGRKRFSTHKLMHLYIKRMEEFRELFKKTMEITDADIPDRCYHYMWRDGRDQALAAPKFTGMGSSGSGVKLMGSKSVYSMHFQKRYLKNDEALHRHLVHNTAHLLTAQVSPAQWIGKFGGGWLDAGLAHYFEFKLDEKCTTYCYQEVATNMDFKGGKWLVPIRKMVAAKRKIPSFATLCTKNTDGLEAREHAICFSYVHFLLEGDWKSSKAKVDGKKGRGRALTRLLRVLKKKKPTREGLRDVYGWTGLSLEEKWREWVLRTYPTR